MTIENGWTDLKGQWLLPECPQQQVDMLRQSFFGGAGYMLAQIKRIQTESPTPAHEFLEMTKLQKEMTAFFDDFKVKHLPTKGNA